MKKKKKKKEENEEKTPKRLLVKHQACKHPSTFLIPSIYWTAKGHS